ncbi:hypothetical protein I4U23_021084 [Adineta vaga]|nr:hypothetical protein I4U23_021084 [Adineta vaga]
MIIIHLLFWSLILFLIYILIKCREYINAISLFFGALFIEKLHLTNVLFDNSIYHVFSNYFYWLVKSNPLVIIISIFITISTFSTLLAMFKQWIKIGVLVTILYWFSS